MMTTYRNHSLAAMMRSPALMRHTGPRSQAVGGGASLVLQRHLAYRVTPQYYWKHEQ
jgi:hypothetical protein